MFELDHSTKNLQVAVLDDIVENFKGNTGLVYDPKEIYSEVNTSSKTIFEDFFTSGKVYSLVSIKTQQGPGELCNVLKRDFGVEINSWIGGIIAPFRATEEQAKAIIEDLKRNPQKYFKSGEKLRYPQ